MKKVEKDEEESRKKRMKKLEKQMKKMKIDQEDEKIWKHYCLLRYVTVRYDPFRSVTGN